MPFSCPLVAIPYATPVSAEMLMAKVDYRDVQITTFTQQNFVAKYRLPLPPESGNQQDVADNIHWDGYDSFAGDLQKLIAKGITTHLFEQEVEQGVIGDKPLGEQDRIDFVKQALADRAEDREYSYYFIIDIDSIGGQDQSEIFSSALKQTYPHCAIIYHVANSDKRLKETSDYRNLREILDPLLKDG